MKILLWAFISLILQIPTQKKGLQKGLTTVQKGEVEISISDTNTEKKDQYDSTFSVIIKNNTDSVACFYEDWNSWGYYNISLEIRTRDKTYHINKKLTGWDKNFPSYVMLMPGDSMTTNYSKDCLHIWHGFDCISIKDIDSAKVTVIYQLETGMHRMEYLTWPGRFCRNANDERSDLQVYQCFPTSKLFSKEYNIEIRNYSIQSIK